MPDPITRRQFLYLATLASGAGLLAACSQATPAQPTTVPTAAPKPTTAPATSAPAAAAPTGAPPPVAAPTLAPTLAAAGPPPVAKVGQAVPKDHPTIAALYEAAKKEGKVSWWDQHEQSVAQKFIDGFQKQFPGVTVEFFEGTQDVTLARGVQEARAGRVSFDFIDTGQNYGPFKDAGLIDAKTDFTDLLVLAGVANEFIVNGTYSPEFNVYGCSYNTEMLKEEELPTSWDGFADPKWKGKLAIETRLRPFVYGTPFWAARMAWSSCSSASKPTIHGQPMATPRARACWSPASSRCWSAPICSV